MLGVVRWDGQPADAAVKRGGIFHEHFHGRKAVPFIDDGHLALQVWCKEDGGANEGDVVRYAMAFPSSLRQSPVSTKPSDRNSVLSVLRAHFFEDLSGEVLQDADGI
jgi:hypothetical protein